MRTIKRLLTLSALGVGLALTSAAPAGASGESIGVCIVEHVLEKANHTEGFHLTGDAAEDMHHLEELMGAEAFEELEAEAEDCLDAPNPLLPEKNEIIWGSVGFLVVFSFLAKFGAPAIKKSMQERTAKIQSDIDAAEQARADAEAVKADYESKVADAKAEAVRIIEEARQAADQLKSDQQARLADELAASRAAAQADIDAAKGQAMNELRGEVAQIALGAAESVVGASLDRNAQIQLIENYINSVGSNGQA